MITLILELILRLWPDSGVSKDSILIYYIPLLPFEQIEFLQILIPSVLNAVLLISPHVVSAFFSADYFYATVVDKTVSAAPCTSSLPDNVKTHLIQSVGESALLSNLEIIKQ